MNTQFNNFKHIFNITSDQLNAIVTEIEANPQFWDSKGPRTGIVGGPFQAQEEIIVRFNNLALINHPEFDWKESINYPPFYALTELQKFIFMLSAVVQGERIGRVMVTKLPAGSKINPHNDGEKHPGYFHRFHLTLKSNSEVTFRCGDEIHYETPGEVFAFNNKLEHEVINNGDSERWTLIIDIKKPIMFVEPEGFDKEALRQTIANIEARLEYGSDAKLKENVEHNFERIKLPLSISNITVGREMTDTFIEELKPFLPTHFEELALDQEDVPLDPDYDAYILMEKLGQLHIFTMRDGDTLVGYIISFIKPHIHYKSSLHCIVDIYYTDKQYRKGGNGMFFFKEWEKDIKNAGVVKIITSTKMHQLHKVFFEHLGYTHSDEAYVKILKS